MLTNRSEYIGPDALILRQVWVFIGELKAEARMLLDEPHQVLGLCLASHICTVNHALLA